MSVIMCKSDFYFNKLHNHSFVNRTSLTRMQQESKSSDLLLFDSEQTKTESVLKLRLPKVK